MPSGGQPTKGYCDDRESIKKSDTLVDSLYGCSYEERLINLKLTTLETRRLRGDMIEVFKICKGFDDVNLHDFFHSEC